MDDQQQPRRPTDEELDPHGNGERDDPVYGHRPDAESGGEQFAPPDEPTHEGAPHDQSSREPLGPLTPDEERPLGDTGEAHDEITPHDLPKDHPGRAAAQRLADEGGGTTRGNT